MIAGPEHRESELALLELGRGGHSNPFLYLDLFEKFLISVFIQLIINK